jgi:DNA-binding NarL/FixJ family response regulator
MSKDLTMQIFDGLTGEIIIRPLTSEELTQMDLDQAAQEALQAKQDAKIAARQSALAKLAALGLTEEEIGAL